MKNIETNFLFPFARLFIALGWLRSGFPYGSSCE